MVTTEFLLDDHAVASFIVNGYHQVASSLPVAHHQCIVDQLDALTENPGDAVLDEVDGMRAVLDDPVVVGVLQSLLGKGYALHSHRHWHCKKPGSSHMHWHQDSTNSRGRDIRRLFVLYYPQTVTAEMGPTMVVPGTQYRNAPTDRMGTYSNLIGQLPLTVPAGTVVIAHYDIWHGTAPNVTADRERHMVKFLFDRTADNDAPTWDHNPNWETPLNWNSGSEQSVSNILTFGNPAQCGGSDHYKERRIRKQIWRRLLGQEVS